MDKKIITKTAFIKKDDQILKINLKINKSQIVQIINGIILNCSRVEKISAKKEVSYHFDDYQSNPHYRNVKINNIRSPFRDCGYGDDDHPGERIVSYTYYDYPSIVDELFCLISNSSKFNIKFSEVEDKSLDLEARGKELEEILVSNLNDKEKINQIRKLAENLVKDTDPEVKFATQKVNDYFQSILDCLDFIVDGVSTEKEIDDFYRFYSFLKPNREDYEENITSIDDLDPIMREKLLHSINDEKKEEYVLKY